MHPAEAPDAPAESPDAPTSPPDVAEQGPFVVQPQTIAGVLALLRGWGCEG